MGERAHNAVPGSTYQMMEGLAIPDGPKTRPLHPYLLRCWRRFAPRVRALTPGGDALTIGGMQPERDSGLSRPEGRIQCAQRPRPTHRDGWHESVEATCVADDATGIRKLRIRECRSSATAGRRSAAGARAIVAGLPAESSPPCLTHTYLHRRGLVGSAIDRGSR